VLSNLDIAFSPRFFSRLKHAILTQQWDVLVPLVWQAAEGRYVQGTQRLRTNRYRGVELTRTSPPVDRRIVQGGPGACMVLRDRTVRLRENDRQYMFDPEYHSFAEDQDFFWWAEKRTLKVLGDPTIVVQHVGGGSFDAKDRNFKRRPTWVLVRSAANYRINSWRHASGLTEWLGWGVGEFAVLARIQLSRGPIYGCFLYIKSWSASISTARKIAARKGALRDGHL
jgi:hypothetical protein